MISPVAVLTAGVPWPCDVAASAAAIASAVRWPKPGSAAMSSIGRGAQLLQRPEVAQQHLAAYLAEPGDVVEQALDHALRTAVAVVGDREPVCLVAHPLQQVEALARARQDDRVRLARPPDLLEPLGEPDDGHVVDAELVEGALRGRDLRRAAVDDDEPGRVGELARPAGVGVDQRRTRAPPAVSPRSGPVCSARSSSSRRNRRVIVSCIAATSFWPSTPRITKRR